LSVSDQHARLGLRAAILASIFLGLIPAWWPELDLKVAAAFYDDARGFANHDLPVITVIYHGINWLARGAFLALAFGLAGGMAFQASRNFGQLPTSAPRPLRPPRVRQAMACALLSLVIGPGLLVNLVLKENVGRARPIQVEAFGGNRQFSPALRQAHECTQLRIRQWSRGRWILVRHWLCNFATTKSRLALGRHTRGIYCRLDSNCRWWALVQRYRFCHDLHAGRDRVSLSPGVSPCPALASGQSALSNLISLRTLVRDRQHV